MQDNNSYQTNTKQLPVGGPEAPNVPVESKNDQPQQVEYGYESIKQIEKQVQRIESAEKKEQPKVNTGTTNNQTNTKTNTQANAPTAPVQAIKPKMPSFFGYKIPPAISLNPSLIISKKGKGNPSEARTWIYMLLDRLMKKQSHNS